MSDLERLAGDATTKAAIAIGKDAAKRAVDELLTGEKASASKTENAAASKSRRWKMIALGVLGLSIVIGVIGLVLSYWYWFLAAGVVGVLGLVGYYRLKGRLEKRKLAAEPEERVVSALEPSRPAKRAEVPATEEADAEAAAAERRAALVARRAELEARQRALAEAEAQREQEVDEELAAMKARLKK